MNLDQFNTCVDNHADGLFRFVLGIVRNKVLAEDITQDSYLKIWENRKKINTDKEKSYPLRVWAAAASVAVMIGAGLSLWNGTQSEPAKAINPIQTSQTIAQIAQPIKESDTTATIQVKPQSTQIAPKAKATEAQAKAETTTEKRMTVTSIQAKRQTVLLSSVPPIEITVHTPQEPTIEQTKPTKAKRIEIKFANPFEAFAIDWQGMAAERAQNIELRKEQLQNAPTIFASKFSQLFASNRNNKNRDNESN